MNLNRIIMGLLVVVVTVTIILSFVYTAKMGHDCKLRGGVLVRTPTLSGFGCVAAPRP